MTGKFPTGADLERLKTQLAEGMAYEVLAREWKVNRQTLRSWAVKLGANARKRFWAKEEVEWLRANYATTPWEGLEQKLGRNREAIRVFANTHGMVKVENVNVPRWNDPLCINQDCLIIGDPHTPFHSGRWLQQCLELAAHWHTPVCILAGDGPDVMGLSTFGRDPKITLAEEQKAWWELERTLLGVFEEVYWLMGNHEERLARALSWQLSPSEAIENNFVSNKERVHVTGYHWCLVYDQLQVEHPQNVSVMPGSVAAKLAVKYRKDIAAFHGHKFGVVQDISGRNVAMDIGPCADPAKLAYISAVHSTAHPVPLQGALLVKKWPDGVVRYHPLAANERLFYAEGLKAMYDGIVKRPKK